MSDHDVIQTYINFDEYIRQGEPSQREAAYAWSTAIGLQAVDGLKTSDYLNDLARRNIEGEITIDEVGKLLDSYYESKTVRENGDIDKEEADKASKNIKKILSVKTIDFSTKGYISVHRRIFEGVMKHAGKLREYDISKREWILEGDTVDYLNWEDLHRALDYDIEQERNFSYKGITNDQLVAHITKFVSGLWQIHPFGEGNTRTTAVFTIQYLRLLGFDVENDLFAKHSWYFRNALVRANYKNAKKGIDFSPVYLERFFRNLLFGEQWVLRNRYLHIHPPKEWSIQPNLAVQDKYRTTTPTSTRTSTEQVPDKYPTSTRQVPDKLHTNNLNIIKLVQLVGEHEMSVKEMITLVGLKDRENFLNVFLTPAINEGYIRLLHPDKPHHPRQKYLLTTKGILLNNDIKS
ncbi:MAG: Fic family protein [Bacteroidales bacterium]|nr:Fic family protein [Bacteroidales bacterium]